MPSLYVHLPFCAKKCRYCDFYSVGYDSSRADLYLASLEKEIAQCKKYRIVNDSTAVRTLYVGGGTPSVLSASQLRALCVLIRDSFPLFPDAEWTVECNPESFSREKAAVLLESGVTRLSFGFQSLDDKELSFLGRIHTAGRCREILAEPLLSRFGSIGADLMYGLPGQTTASLEKTLGAIVESPCVKHISAYELTIADDTPLGRHRSLLPLPGDRAMAGMTRRLWELLALHGFEQYEISNFAQTGHRCRHNEAYWNHEPYLGLGCSAHSYMPPRRWSNTKDLSKYAVMVEAGEFPRDFTETIDARKLAAEMVFLGLRRTKGINEETFVERCELQFRDFADREKLSAFVDEGLISYDKPFWKPSQKGLLMADAMARELM